MNVSERSVVGGWVSQVVLIVGVRMSGLFLIGPMLVEIVVMWMVEVLDMSILRY